MLCAAIRQTLFCQEGIRQSLMTSNFPSIDKTYLMEKTFIKKKTFFLFGGKLTIYFKVKQKAGR